MMCASKRKKPKKQFRPEVSRRGVPGNIAAEEKRAETSSKMPQHIAHITLVVRDYDEAIAFFTQSLGFELIEDTPSKDRQGQDKRGCWSLRAARAGPRSFWQKLRMKKRSPASAIKPEAAFSLSVH